MNSQALWYLTRGTGVVALILLTLVVLLGVTSTFRWRSHRLPKFLVAGLHRNLTLLSLAFLAVHIVTAVLDTYAPIHLVDVVVPFVGTYRPIWLGLGALAFDLLLALVVTSLLRARVGVRLWRGLHWLAYAAWPLALVHGLGTGTDPRASWMLVLTGACVLVVVAAGLARVAGADGGPGHIRLAGGLAALVLPVGLLVWAQGGPLASGWARRAGTPPALLGGGKARRTAAATSTVGTRIVTAAFASPPFDASVHGSVSESSWRNGLVHVALDGTTSGGAKGKLHVDLYGQPLGDGGVQMTASRVTFGPPSSPHAYAGSIVALEGTRISISLHSAGGRQMALRLRLDLQGTSFSGRLHAGTGSPGA